MAIAAVLYLLLGWPVGLIAAWLFLLCPVLAIGSVVLVRLARNGYDLRSQTPVLRSRHRLVAAGSWGVLVLALIVLAGLDVYFVLSGLTMLFFLLKAIWETTADSPMRLRQRIMRLAVLWLVPPLGLALWFVPASKGWRRLVAIYAVLAAARIYLLAITVLLIAPEWLSAGQGDLSFSLKSIVRVVPIFFLTGGILVLVATFVQLVYHRHGRAAPLNGLPLEDGDAVQPDALDQPRSAHIVLRCVGAILSVGLWLGIVVSLGLPWIIVSLRADSDGWVFVATLLSAAAIITISLSSLWRELNTQVRHGTSWWPREALPAIAGALLLALSLTFARVIAGGFQHQGQPFGWGLSIGLAIGLSVGLGQSLGLHERWVQVSSSFVAIFLCGMLLVWSITDSPRPWALFESLAGLVIGLLAGELLLVPGLAAFAVILPYLKKMLLPLVGFTTGYLFILFSFAGLFYATYTESPTTFVIGGTAPRLWDFIYFSLNTIAPLGYSSIHPSSGWTEFLSGLELIAGIGWLVVVFGALLASIGSGPALDAPAPSRKG